MANYLPGLFGSPHPIPQETTPNESATSFTMQEIDPPESPLNKNLDNQKDRDLIRRLVNLLTNSLNDQEHETRFKDHHLRSWIWLNPKGSL